MLLAFKTIYRLHYEEEERNSLLSYDCNTGFATKILDPSSAA